MWDGSSDGGGALQPAGASNCPSTVSPCVDGNKTICSVSREKSSVSGSQMLSGRVLVAASCLGRGPGRTVRSGPNPSGCRCGVITSTEASWGQDCGQNQRAVAQRSTEWGLEDEDGWVFVVSPDVELKNLHILLFHRQKIELQLQRCSFWSSSPTLLSVRCFIPRLWRRCLFVVDLIINDGDRGWFQPVRVWGFCSYKHPSVESLSFKISVCSTTFRLSPPRFSIHNLKHTFSINHAEKHLKFENLK